MKFLAIITLIILFGLISASQVQEEDNAEIAVTQASLDPCSIYRDCTACMSLTSSCFFDTVSQTCKSAGLYSLDICNDSNNVIWSLSLLFTTMIITLLFV